MWNKYRVYQTHLTFRGRTDKMLVHSNTLENKRRMTNIRLTFDSYFPHCLCWLTLLYHHWMDIRILHRIPCHLLNPTKNEPMTTTKPMTPKYSCHTEHENKSRISWPNIIHSPRHTNVLPGRSHPSSSALNSLQIECHPRIMDIIFALPPSRRPSLSSWKFRGSNVPVQLDQRPSVKRWWWWHV